MSAIARSWVKALCPTCGEKQVLEIEHDAPPEPADAMPPTWTAERPADDPWRLVCTVCGAEKTLAENGLIDA